MFSTATALTDSLGLLYLLWNNGTPILYDAMAVSFVTRPDLCPVEPMHLSVDDAGVTRVRPGAPNAQVCMHSDSNTFFNYYLPRLTGPRLTGTPRPGA